MKTGHHEMASGRAPVEADGQGKRGLVDRGKTPSLRMPGEASRDAVDTNDSQNRTR